MYFDHTLVSFETLIPSPTSTIYFLICSNFLCSGFLEFTQCNLYCPLFTPDVINYSMVALPGATLLNRLPLLKAINSY